MWYVAPFCDKQKKDIDPKDILDNFTGKDLFRRCNIHDERGIQDRFGEIYQRRFGYLPDPNHFVVQLWGCPLRCPYCYVTPEGVRGDFIPIGNESLLHAYEQSGLEVFHLMGGAPALYLDSWNKLYDRVKVFHSDFLLVEGEYEMEHLRFLKGLFAVSIKERYIYPMEDLSLLWRNLERLVQAKVDFYVTFTGSEELRPEIEQRFGTEILEDSYLIPIRRYIALEE